MQNHSTSTVTEVLDIQSGKKFVPGRKGDAVIYLRVSTAKQRDEGMSIEMQRKETMRHGFLNEYNILDELGDPGVSALKKNRDDVQKLKQLVIDEKIKAVITFELSRLAREPVFSMELQKLFKKHGVQWLSVTDQIPEGPFGDLYLYLKQWSNWEQLQLTRMRSMQTKRSGAEDNFLTQPGRTPYGYIDVYVPDPKHPKGRRIHRKANPIKVNGVDQVEMVKQMYNWADLDGLACHAIARRLNAMNIPAPMTGRMKKKPSSGKWFPATVQGILSNDTYKGKQYQYKEKVVGDDEGEKKMVARPRSEWVEIKGAADQIITEAQWQRVQDRQRTWSSGKKLTPDGSLPYLFRDHLHCNCGDSMGCRDQGGSPRYYCHTRYRTNATPCGIGTVDQKAFEEAAWAVIVEALSQPDVVIREMRRRHEEAGPTAKAQDLENKRETLADLQKQIDRDTRQMRRLDEDSTQYRILDEILEEQGRAETILKRDIERLVEELELIELTPQKIALVEEACRIVAEDANAMPYDLRRKVLIALKISVHMTSDRLHYEMRGNLGGIGEVQPFAVAGRQVRSSKGSCSSTLQSANIPFTLPFSVPSRRKA